MEAEVSGNHCLQSLNIYLWPHSSDWRNLVGHQEHPTFPWKILGVTELTSLQSYPNWVCLPPQLVHQGKPEMLTPPLTGPSECILLEAQPTE